MKIGSIWKLSAARPDSRTYSMGHPQEARAMPVDKLKMSLSYFPDRFGDPGTNFAVVPVPVGLAEIEQMYYSELSASRYLYDTFDDSNVSAWASLSSVFSLPTRAAIVNGSGDLSRPESATRKGQSTDALPCSLA